MEKIDFKKSLKSLYRATGKIQEIDAGQGHFLVIAGQGEPGGEAGAHTLHHRPQRCRKDRYDELH